MNELATILLDYIRKRRTGTSYVNLMDVAKEAGYEVDGTTVIAHGDKENIVLWAGVSENFADAILSLVIPKLVIERSTPLLVYLADGRIIRLPLARKFRDYKKPHWCPTVFDAK